ncbi:MAG: GTP-binding protein, partial [Lachnospiraceae bacterium]|nr:GTP-binding protein [Lachnospiraceae bacterium]
MTKIDIISGFLGAGKTTLIKKLIAEGFQGEKLVLIENEFGEIGIDGGFLKDAGVQINEMNSGCICCSLVGDFGEALKQVLDEYTPDRIIIEPSGVGKLSDVMKAVADMHEEAIVINSASTVVDAQKCKMYMKNFGEFFNNQIESAGTIILSRSQKMTEEKLEAVVAMIKEHNEKATVITTAWDDIDGSQIVAAMEKEKSLVEELMEEERLCPTCGHVHEHGEYHNHEHHHEEH